MGRIIEVDLDRAGCAKPMPQDASYIVVFTRDPEGDYIDNPSDDREGITQMHNEIQEAFDVTGISGNFRVMGRLHGGRWTTTEEALSDE